jgi:hypothetical protein
VVKGLNSEMADHKALDKHTADVHKAEDKHATEVHKALDKATAEVHKADEKAEVSLSALSCSLPHTHARNISGGQVQGRQEGIGQVMRIEAQ